MSGDSLKPEGALLWLWLWLWLLWGTTDHGPFTSHRQLARTQAGCAVQNLQGALPDPPAGSAPPDVVQLAEFAHAHSDNRDPALPDPEASRVADAHQLSPARPALPCWRQKPA